MLVPSDWRFVGEGNAHLVYRYVGVDNNPYFTGMVLKLLKNAAEEDADRLMHQHQFVQNIVIGDPFSQSHHLDGDCLFPGSNSELALLGEEDDEEEEEGNEKDFNWRLQTSPLLEDMAGILVTNEGGIINASETFAQASEAMAEGSANITQKCKHGNIPEVCSKPACWRGDRTGCVTPLPCVMKGMTVHATQGHKLTDSGAVKYSQTCEANARETKCKKGGSTIVPLGAEEPPRNSRTAVPNAVSHALQVKVKERVALEQMECLERVYRQARRARQFFTDRGLVSPVHIPAQQLHLFENKHTIKLREQAVSKRMRSNPAMDFKFLHHSESCLSEDVCGNRVTKDFRSTSRGSMRRGRMTSQTAFNLGADVNKCPVPLPMTFSDTYKLTDVPLGCGFENRGLSPSRSSSCPPRLAKCRKQMLPSTERQTLSQPHGFLAFSQGDTGDKCVRASDLPCGSGVVENIRNSPRVRRFMSSFPFSYSFQNMRHLSWIRDSLSVPFAEKQSAPSEGPLSAQDMRSSFALLENDLVTPPVSAERLLSVRESSVGKHLGIQNAGRSESSGWIYMTCELKPKTGLPALVLGLPDLVTEITAPRSTECSSKNSELPETSKGEKELSAEGDVVTASSFNRNLQLSHKSLNWGNPSRFTLQQELKLKHRAVSTRSFFKPEIFFGQLSSRQVVVDQLKALICRPQNNCRIFLDGARIVWCEEQKSVRRSSPSPPSTLPRCTVSGEGNWRALSKRHAKQKSFQATKTLRCSQDGRRDENAHCKRSERQAGKRRTARHRLRKKFPLQRDPHHASPYASGEKAFFCHCLDVGTTAAPALSTIIASAALLPKTNTCPEKRNYVLFRQLQFLGPVSFLFGWTVSGLFPTPAWLLTRFFYDHKGEEIEVQTLCDCEIEENNLEQQATKAPKQADVNAFSTQEKKLSLNREKTTKTSYAGAQPVCKAYRREALMEFPHQKKAVCSEVGHDHFKESHSKESVNATNVDLSVDFSSRGANTKVSSIQPDELPNTILDAPRELPNKPNLQHSSTAEDTTALLARLFLRDFPTEIRLLPDVVADTNEALNAAVELFGEVVYRESNLFHRLLYVHALCEGQQCLADALFKELVGQGDAGHNGNVSAVAENHFLITEDEQLTGSTAPSSFEEMCDIKDDTRSYKNAPTGWGKKHARNEIDANYLMSDSHAIPALQEFLQSLESEIAETKTNWNFQKTVVVPEVIAENATKEEVDDKDVPTKTTTVDPEALLARRIQLWHYSRGYELLRQCQESSGSLSPSLKQSVIHWIYRFLIGRTFLDCSVMLNVAITVNEDQSDVQRLAQNRFVKLCTTSPLVLDPVVPDIIPCPFPLMPNGGFSVTPYKGSMEPPPVNCSLAEAEQLLSSRPRSTSDDRKNLAQEEDDSIITAKLVRHALQRLRIPVFNGRTQLGDYIRSSATHKAATSQQASLERIQVARTSDDYIWKAFGQLLSPADTHAGTYHKELASHATVWYRVSVVDLDLKQASKIPQWATQLLDILGAQQPTTANASPSPHSNAMKVS